MSWKEALYKGAAIVISLMITTVWLPARLYRLSMLKDRGAALELAVLAVWSFFLFGGMWLLRQAQRRSWI